MTQPLSREQSFAKLKAQSRFDVIVIGGGSTGLGVALDAAARGLSVALFESHDLASGTSSRSTKLVHGGVRYLAQGHIPLVREALRERSTLLHNAPHNAHPLTFVMPSFQWWEKPFYGVGLKVYDALAGSHGLGATAFLSKKETLDALPGVRSQGITGSLTGGVRYLDGQFNDARLAIDLARTAASLGALIFNYCDVLGLIEDAGQVVGVRVVDKEAEQSYNVQSGCVINAAGVWADALRGEGNKQPAGKLVEPSRGVHLVVSRDFMPTDSAMLIPKTRDGRVLFIVPWLGHLILGTTDTPVLDAPREPHADKVDVDFILGEAAHYLERAPTRDDVLSCWAGLRPLVQNAAAGATAAVSREHTVEIAANGLITAVGGKWTTYRAMSEDVLLHAIAAKRLPAGTITASVTGNLPILGADSPCNTPDLEMAADPSFVRFAIKHEFARCVEDVLARRSRALFLNAARAEKLAPAVATELTQQGLRAGDVASFILLAKQYQRCP